MIKKFKIGDNFKNFDGTSNPYYDTWLYGKSIDGVNNHDWADASDTNRSLRQLTESDKNYDKLITELSKGFTQKIISGCELYDELIDWRISGTTTAANILSKIKITETTTAASIPAHTVAMSGPCFFVPEGTYTIEVTTTGAFNGIAGKITVYHTNNDGLETIVNEEFAPTTARSFFVHPDYKNDLSFTITNGGGGILTVGDIWTITVPKQTIPFIVSRTIGTGTQPTDLTTTYCAADAYTLSNGILSGNDYSLSQFDGNFYVVQPDEQSFYNLVSKELSLDFTENSTRTGSCGFFCTGLVSSTDPSGLGITTYDFGLWLEDVDLGSGAGIEKNISFTTVAALTIGDIIILIQAAIDVAAGSQVCTVSYDTNLNDVIITHDTAMKNVMISNGTTNTVLGVGTFGTETQAKKTQLKATYIDEIDLNTWTIRESAVNAPTSTTGVTIDGLYTREVAGTYRLTCTIAGEIGAGVARFKTAFAFDGSTFTDVDPGIDPAVGTSFDVDSNFPGSLEITLSSGSGVINEYWDFVIYKYNPIILRNANGVSIDTIRRDLNENVITENCFNYVEEFYDMIIDGTTNRGIHDFNAIGTTDLTDLLYLKLDTRLVFAISQGAAGTYKWNFVILNKTNGRIESWHSTTDEVAGYAAGTRTAKITALTTYLNNTLRNDFVLLYSIAFDNFGTELGLINEDYSGTTGTGSLVYSVTNAAARGVLALSGVLVLGDRVYQVDIGTWYRYDGAALIQDL